MAKVWLVTGSGNGLGGTSRGGAGRRGQRGSRSASDGGTGPLVAQYGARVKPVTLEVREEAAAKAAVQLAVDTFGRLDVLVNNAVMGSLRRSSR